MKTFIIITVILDVCFLAFDVAVHSYRFALYETVLLAVFLLLARIAIRRQDRKKGSR